MNIVNVNILSKAEIETHVSLNLTQNRTIMGVIGLMLGKGLKFLLGFLK